MADSHDETESLKQLFELALDMLAIGDLQGRLRRVNRAWTRVLGWSTAQFLAAPPLELVHPDDRVAARAALSAAASGSTSSGFECRFRRRDGGYRWLLWSAAADLGGRVLYIVAHDVTERRRVDEERSHARRLESLGRLSGGIAHDLNNMLAVISGYGELLQRRARAEMEERYLAEILRASDRAAGLTRQLLAFSRREHSQPRGLNLNAVLSGVSGMLERLIGPDVRLVIEPGPSLGHIHADPGQIEQVVMNLVINARDAMPQGGTLTIATRNAEGGTPSEGGPAASVVLSVSDTGTGMDEETRSRIFEPYFTTKESGKGTGLGLATVHGIVSQSGGRIEVDSVVGMGSTFHLHFPLVVRDAAETGHATEDAPPGGTEAVLVADDEDAVRGIVVEMLASAGYRTFAARDGREALAFAADRTRPLDLLLTDMLMPGIGGAELAELWAALRPQASVLYMSGYVDLPERAHLPADAPLLMKPFTATELLRAVRDVLERANRSAEGPP